MTEKRSIPIMKPYFDGSEAQAVAETLASGWVAQGPRVAEFEKAVAAYEGSRFGIATTSCTTALHLALVGMGFGPGDDVLVPSYTFVATPNSVEYTGTTAILVEVRTDTYTIDTDWLEKFIPQQYQLQGDIWVNRDSGNHLRGIIPVHLFGLCADMEAVNRFASQYNLLVLEDSACALGAMIGDTHEGGFGNPSALSFHPRKSITTGEGGMVLTNDEQLANQLRKLRSHAASLSEVQRHQNRGYLLPDYDELGFNYRMTDIQAAVGVVQMKKLDFIRDERRRIAAIYDREIPKYAPYLSIPLEPEGYTHIYQTYASMVNPERLGFSTIEEAHDFRNELMEYLDDAGIATRQGTHATHILGYYRKLRKLQPYDLPGAYACDRLSLALPLYVGMSESDQFYVLEHLRDFGREKGIN
jgi:dTDP-4-amino-4,6-dideoxygalactose transaminase